MAGGYGAGAASLNHKWLLNTVYAPTTITKAETFLWYRANPRLQVGVAFLWEQSAFRALGSYQLVSETATRPSLSLSVGVQGIGTGNPGYSATAEKNWSGRYGGLNAFAGIGLRSNENHSHLLGGFRWSPPGRLSLGLQLDGHQEHPFATYGLGQWTMGAYLIDGERAAWMVGVQF